MKPSERQEQDSSTVAPDRAWEPRRVVAGIPWRDDNVAPGVVPPTGRASCGCFAAGGAVVPRPDPASSRRSQESGQGPRCPVAARIVPPRRRSRTRPRTARGSSFRWLPPVSACAGSRQSALALTPGQDALAQAQALRASPRAARRRPIHSRAHSIAETSRGGVRDRWRRPCPAARMLVSFLARQTFTFMSPARRFSPTIWPS